MFHHLLEGDLLCLGLYRKEERKYTFTNPNPDIKIHLTDIVYVIDALVGSSDLELSKDLEEEEPKEIEKEEKTTKKGIIKTLSSLFKPKDSKQTETTSTEMETLKTSGVVLVEESEK